MSRAARILRMSPDAEVLLDYASHTVTVLFGSLAQVLITLIRILGVLAIYTKDAFGWILTSFSVFSLVIGLSLQDILVILTLHDRRGTLWLIVDDREKPIGGDEIGAVLAQVPGVAADPKPTVELRSVIDGRACYLIGLWASDHDAIASLAIGALRVRFPHGEVHGA